MKGTFVPGAHSNHSWTLSARIAGAKGRNASRNLIAGVDDVLAVLAARVEQDRAVAQRALPELHLALKPADDLAVDEVLCRAGRRIVDDLGGTA